MAFKERTALDADVTISLTGINKVTGKPNPNTITGYYLGNKTVEDRKKKSGVSFIHFFQTPKGNIGVWGKTDLDRKMLTVNPGEMVRVTQSGTRETANGDMYLFKVEVDADNTIEVNVAPAANNTSTALDGDEEAAYSDEAFEEESALDEEQEVLDELPPARPAAKKAAAVASTPDAARQAKVKALLGGSRKSA